MKLVKFFLALLAGLGFAKFLGFVAELDDFNDEDDNDIYDDELEYPLFV